MSQGNGEAEDLVAGLDGNANLGMQSLLTAIMKQFGGPAGFAQAVKTDYDANPEGSANRVRIGTAILGAVQKHGAEDGDGEADDERALEAEAQRLLAARAEPNEIDS